MYLLLLSVSLYAKELKKKDEFGRNYLQYNSDRTQFLLDEDYFLTIPSIKQLKLHDSELDTLLAHRKNLEALNLVSNLKYCLLSEKEEIQKKNYSLLKKWGNLYNQLFAKYKDVVYENEFLTDPAICIKNFEVQDSYFLKSQSFSFRLKIPKKFEFQHLHDFSFVNEGVYKWKALVFKEKFPIKNFDDYPLQDMLEYLSRKKPLPQRRGGKIFLMFLVHKYDTFSEKLMLDFWDRKRGLTSQNKEQYKFQRKFLDKESISEFQVLESDGEIVQYECRERLFGKGERSVGIFFVYPAANREVYSKDFQEISIRF